MARAARLQGDAEPSPADVDANAVEKSTIPSSHTEGGDIDEEEEDDEAEEEEEMVVVVLVLSLGDPKDAGSVHCASWLGDEGTDGGAAGFPATPALGAATALPVKVAAVDFVDPADSFVARSAAPPPLSAAPAELDPGNSTGARNGSEVKRVRTGDGSRPRRFTVAGAVVGDVAGTEAAGDVAGTEAAGNVAGFPAEDEGAGEDEGEGEEEEATGEASRKEESAMGWRVVRSDSAARAARTASASAGRSS